MTESKRSKATDEKKFDHLYDNLLKYHTVFIETSFKLAGLFLLVIGWLLTSKSAQASFQGSKWLSFMAIVGLIISGFVSNIGGHRVQTFSRNMFDELKKLNYMPEGYYSDRLIKKRTMFLYTSAIWILILSASVLIIYNHFYLVLSDG